MFSKISLKLHPPLNASTPTGPRKQYISRERNENKKSSPNKHPQIWLTGDTSTWCSQSSGLLRQNLLFILAHSVWRNEFGNTYVIHVAIAIDCSFEAVPAVGYRHSFPPALLVSMALCRQPLLQREVTTIRNMKRSLYNQKILKLVKLVTLRKTRCKTWYKNM